MLLDFQVTYLLLITKPAAKMVQITTVSKMLLQTTSEQITEQSSCIPTVSNCIGQLTAKLGQNAVQVHPGEEMTPILDPGVLQQPRTLSSC